MKLLLVMDNASYSRRAAEVAARFAVNTWADVTILHLDESGASQPDAATRDGVIEARERFLGEGTPYGTGAAGALEKTGEGQWRLSADGEPGRKALQVLVRRGDGLRAVSEQVRRDGTDFIVLGASDEDRQWGGDPRFAQRVVSGVECSSLVVKGETAGKTLVCCLDQAAVSQASLEIINQLVTLGQAELKIVGVTGAKGLREKVELRMMEVLRYYAKRGVQAWVRVVDEEELESFAREASRSGGLGLWLGEQSLLRRIFSKDRLGKLLSASTSSVVVLK